MLQGIFSAALKRMRMHPTNPGVQVGAHAGKVFPADDHVATAGVNVVFEHQGDRLRAEGLRKRTAVGPDFLDGADQAAGQYHDFLSDAHNAARDLAAEPAEVV